ncbi:AraC family transcriptional regulator [Clostridium sp. HBUAS56010]|uniref:helix-turn-helix transcriptional regulator n=1 Tax=Clostridium sp. HBUAS56010 TaxID=2571127 RepID=UPI0011781C53|nr:AraC family transcriptional regulator [Clostridium sp. HBUAS56010]
MKKDMDMNFSDHVLRHLTFTPEYLDHYILYQNRNRPELGYSLQYNRADYYNIGIGNYTVAEDFVLPFSHDMTFLKFGLFYEGKTEVELKHEGTIRSTPSSFCVMESAVSGTQRWKKGQHLYGIEISVYEPYFRDVIKSISPENQIMDQFEKNRTYFYMPEEMIRIIETIRGHMETRLIQPIFLESKVLECLSILTSAVAVSKNHIDSLQVNYGKIAVGKSRILRLNSSDIKALNEAHDILCAEFSNPPSIKELSQRVFLNEQKLRVEFSHYYHSTIGQFLRSLRMTKAVNLLAATDQSVSDIASEIGYSNSSNFSRVFKKVYGMTPFEFRDDKLSR